MIEISEPSMAYPLEAGSLDVLSAVNMHIADGETVAIAGPTASLACGSL